MSDATPPANVRIAIVEDEPLLREDLIAMVEAQPGFVLAGSADSVAGGRKLIASGIDVLLTDLGLPDGHGSELIALARTLPSPCKVLVVSVFGDVANVVRAIEAGADGYLLKGTDTDQAVAAIRTVLSGGAPISPAVAGHILARVRRDAPIVDPDPPPLTPREIEVLTALAKGLSYREVARVHNVSTHTIADHVKAIYKKLAVHSKSEAVYEAVQAGLIRLTET